MQASPIRILSNLPGLESLQDSHRAIVHEPIGATNSLRGLVGLLRAARRADVVVLNIETRVLLFLCLWRMLWPFGRWRLVSLDLVLSRPASTKQQVVAWAKKQLFRRVDRFVLYFKDIGPYATWYGITQERTTYVPFKVNIWRTVEKDGEPSDDGDYVLTAGRSKRDLETFLAAMDRVEYPGILLHQPHDTIARHGTTIPRRSLPPNVQAVEDRGGQESWIEYLRGARVVVLATKAETISPSGISTYLDAMALNRCVIATEGPATRGLVSDEAMLVPPGDIDALAQAITTAWEDTALRQATAARGYAYAMRLEGEERLMADIAEVCSELVSVQARAEA